MTTKSLQFQAYQAIRKKIIYSDLEPGKKISEKGLEEMLNIGRTPIRESLIQLRQQELVYTIPQSGTYVSKIDLSSAKNARFVRKQIERQVMMECCAKLTSKTKKVLETIIEEQEKAVSVKDSRAFFHTDNLFHETCFEIANRQEVWQWLDGNNTHLERFRWLRVITKDLNWDIIMNQHYQLFNAIVNHDPEEANFITSLHLHMMLDDQETILKRFPDYFK
ncbi:GntR family transcriptional regulator [Bacillus pseudomycoides]|uniref:GntR family transcriptional regulator n=1 Tax=Bacillus pseudomycoides TaxID=64104 RepID=UPI000BF7B7E3|nr:GntR family transcriptional regulator [Bacillus pseudomycoides]PGC29337.1 GntR family transcriptional regulator [Bacillus pseudomycoides]